MPDEKKLAIVGVGLVGAYLILKGKTGSILAPLSKALGPINPSLASPRPTTTNIATGTPGGIPRGPSSGLGQVIGPSSGSSIWSKVIPAAGLASLPILLNKLIPNVGKQTTPSPGSGAAVKSSPTSPKGSSGGGGGGGGGSGGSGSGGQGGSVSNPWSPTPYGFYDGNGNWVPTDIDGNILPGASGYPPGYYDSTTGAYVPYAVDDSGVPITATGDPSAVPVDEYGNPDPAGTYASDGGTTSTDPSAAYTDPSGGPLNYTDPTQAYAGPDLSSTTDPFGLGGTDLSGSADQNVTDSGFGG